MKPITYPVYTVIVFAGSPSSNALDEDYRRSFEDEDAARTYARRTTTTSRTNWQSARTYTPPCAQVYRESSDGKLEQLDEYVSATRRRYLSGLKTAQMVAVQA